MREHVRRIHLVGIGGSGMSGIAEVLSNLGYQVSGSDLQESAATLRLQRMGVSVHIGHDAALVEDCDVVVTSAAIDDANPELAAGRDAKIPVIPRAEMLAELMRFRRGIAVAGTHGKTTTTSLVASVLARGGLDPTFVVGGQVNSVNSNAKLGTSEYLVAEADESDASFLHLQPLVAIVTNVDVDHLDTYGGDFSRLKQTFVDFLYNLPFYGLAVMCIDDPVVREILPEIRKPVLTYGISEDADVRASAIEQHGLHMHFRVSRESASPDLQVRLALAGEHNVLNALAAVAVASRLGVTDDAICAGLEEFQGIARRLQVRGSILTAAGEAILVDDYAHHPTEIAATLKAVVGGWPQRRHVVAFQPHRYTRTRDLLDQFSQVLAEQDPLIITAVYPAGEAPISGADGQALCRSIRTRGYVDPVYVDDVNDLPHTLDAVVRGGDVIVTLGAGDIGQVSKAMAERGSCADSRSQGG